MSIFRSRHASSTHHKPGNRRVAGDGNLRKASGNVHVGEKQKNRRIAESVEKRKSGGNRRVRNANEDASGDTVAEGKRPNRRIKPPAASTPRQPEINLMAETPDVADSPPEERRPSRLLPMLFRSLRVLAVMATIVALLWGARLVYRYALTSTYFALQHVEINGNERLSNQEILDAAGIRMDQNIFEIKLPEVIRRLEDTPWVVDARVSQKLPKTIRIDIVERKPEMLVLFDVPYLVDEGGEIFKRWSPGDPMPECMITGVTRRELAEDPDDTQQMILDAISLRNRYDAVGNRRYAQLYEIHREIDGGFSLTVGKSPFYVKLGKPPYRQKLNRMAQLFAKMGKESREPLIVYFDNEKRPDRITVKYKPASAK